MKRISGWKIAGAFAAAASGLLAGEAIGQTVDPALLARAESLHARAVRAFDVADYARACPMLEQVVRMIPQGLGAKETLAECYEYQGRLASAWRTYDELVDKAAAAGRADQSSRARLKANGLRPKLAAVILSVPKSLRARPGIEIRVGHERVRGGALSFPVPVDTGDHVVSVHAGGAVSWEARVKIQTNGARVLVDVPSDAAGKADRRAPTDTASPRTSGPPPKTEAPRPPSARMTNDVKLKTATEMGGNFQRDGGIFVGIMGLASLGLGMFFAGKGSSSDDQISVIGPGIMIGGGAVAAVGGIVLFVTAPAGEVPTRPAGADPKRSALQILPSIGPRGVAGTIRTTF